MPAADPVERMAKRPAQRNPVVEALKQKFARDPFSRAFLQLAEEYRRAGEYEEAVKVCLEGLQRHPTYHTARIALGRTYLECGNLEEARRTLGEVVAIAPENHLAAKLLAEVHRKLGDTPAAAETYRAILAHYPGDIEVKALLQDLIDGAPAVRPPVAPPAVTRPGARPVVTRPSAPPAPSAPRPVDPVLDYHSDDLAAAGLGKPPGGSPRPWVVPDRPPAVPAAGVMTAIAGPPSVAGPAAPTSGSGVGVKAPGFDQGPEIGSDVGDSTDALQTNTLAELYLRQGLVDRALEVYRAMLRVDPGNTRARQRLQELVAAGTAGAMPVAGPVATPAAALDTATGGARETAMAASRDPERSESPPAPIAHPGTQARIDRLAEWLGRIQTAHREARTP